MMDAHRILYKVFDGNPKGAIRRRRLRARRDGVLEDLVPSMFVTGSRWREIVPVVEAFCKIPKPIKLKLCKFMVTENIGVPFDLVHLAEKFSMSSSWRYGLFGNNIILFKFLCIRRIYKYITMKVYPLLMPYPQHLQRGILI